MGAFAWDAWLTVGVGGVLVLWALYWDRSRGRRRCPKCWYDLGEVQGRLCPECGRTAKHEGRLYLTRRRLGWAAAGVAVIGSAWFVYRVPLLREHGAVVITPTWYMAWRFPDYESPPSINGRFGSELTDRIGRPETADWVRRLLIKRAIETANDPDATPEQIDSALWWILDSEDPNGGTMYRGFVVNERPRYPDRVAATHIDRQGTIDGIVRGLRHENGSVKDRAIAAATSLYSSVGAQKSEHGFLPGHAVLLGALADPDPARRAAAAGVIGWQFLPTERTQALWRLAHDGWLEQPLPPEIAEYDGLYGDDDAFAERVIRDIDHPDERIAVLALHAASNLDPAYSERVSDRVLPLLRAEDARQEQAWNTAFALAERGSEHPNPQRLIDAAIELRESEDGLERLLLVSTLSDRMPDTLFDAVLEAFQRDPDDANRKTTARAWLRSWMENDTLDARQAERFAVVLQLEGG
ncbi:MAG: hypothetical protein AAGF47_02000 [Planctomycetota bacterium]